MEVDSLYWLKTASSVCQVKQLQHVYGPTQISGADFMTSPGLWLVPYFPPDCSYWGSDLWVALALAALPLLASWKHPCLFGGHPVHIRLKKLWISWSQVLCKCCENTIMKSIPLFKKKNKNRDWHHFLFSWVHLVLQWQIWLPGLFSFWHHYHKTCSSEACRWTPRPLV